MGINAEDLDSAAGQLVRLLAAKRIRMAAAESCTAGLAAEAIGRIPGASACFWGSFVCYSREAKIKMLGIGKKLLAEHGLVSGETALAMALGVLKKSGTDAAFSITGIAGPDGDGSSVPVGTVWIATALRPGGPRRIRAKAEKASIEAASFYFSGDRNKIRQEAARTALEQITKKLLQ